LWSAISGVPVSLVDGSSSSNVFHIVVLDSNNNVLESFTNISKLSGATDLQGKSIYYRDILSNNSQYIYAGNGSLAASGKVSLTGGIDFYAGSTSSSFTGTITGNTLTLTQNAVGSFAIGQTLTSAIYGSINNYNGFPKIVSLLTGTLGQSGSTYSISNAQTINSPELLFSSDIGNIFESYDLYSQADNIDVDFVLSGSNLSNSYLQITKAQGIISLVNSRKDCIAFISPYNDFISLSSSSDQLNSIINFFGNLSSSSYTVFDSGYKYIYDPYNATYRYVPCNGDVAGLCVRTSLNNADWVSPAGTTKGNLNNAIKLAYNPSKTDRDKLYQASINPIVSFPGQGIILYGDKTALNYPSAFSRINVRRLFLAIEKTVGNYAKNVLFEMNDSTTRNAFTNSVNSYLSSILSQNGLAAFNVICDASNNTPSVISSNNFVAEIYIQPTYSINFITITFVATSTGLSISENSTNSG
jgi:hypothetical protein